MMSSQPSIHEPPDPKPPEIDFIYSSDLMKDHPPDSSSNPQNYIDFAQVLVKEEVDDEACEREQPQTLVENQQIKEEHAERAMDTIIKTEKDTDQKPVMLEVNIDPILFPNIGEEPAPEGYRNINGRYYCNYCCRQFARKGNVVKHVQSHADKIDKKQCYICLLTFRSQKLRDEHVAGHTAERPYECDRCLKTFRMKKHVKKHIMKDFCKRNGGGDLTCQVCGKMFAYLSLYKSHLVKHETERPFSCDICQMKFKHRSAVTRHMLQHTGVKKFGCPECDKRFYLQGLLKTHMKSHSKERPFMCQICTKTFSLKHTLKKHMKVHLKPKKLTCDICQKTFPRESRLKYHMQVHSREKKFSCDLCKRYFSHKSNVVRHLAARHTEVLNPEFVANLKF